MERIIDNDVEIWQRIKDRDPLAFEHIYVTYRKWLTIVAEGILQDGTEAEDLVQKFFIDLWQKEEIKTSQPMGSLKSFLFISIRNRCFNKIKSDEVRRRRFDSLCLPVGYELPANLIEHKELRKQLNEAIDQLPDIRAKVFQMGYLHQRSRRQIANLLGVSEATVKTHMALALKDGRFLLKNAIH